MSIDRGAVTGIRGVGRSNAEFLNIQLKLRNE